MREKQASFGREKAANWPVWKPLFGKNGLASPKGDLQICSEVGNSRGRVLVPDCPLPALQRHSQILELFSMKVKATGVCQTWQAPYWPQLSYYLSIQTRTKLFRQTLKHSISDCQGPTVLQVRTSLQGQGRIQGAWHSSGNASLTRFL